MFNLQFLTTFPLNFQLHLYNQHVKKIKISDCDRNSISTNFFFVTDSNVKQNRLLLISEILTNVQKLRDTITSFFPKNFKEFSSWIKRPNSVVCNYLIFDTKNLIETGCQQCMEPKNCFCRTICQGRWCRSYVMGSCFVSQYHFCFFRKKISNHVASPKCKVICIL